MKKLIACLLTLTLLAGIVPAVLGAEQDDSIKVLSIGEEFSRSAFDYMYKVFEAEGYSDISVAYLNGYKEGVEALGLSSITDYANGRWTGATYSFCKNVRDFADDIASDYTLKMALQEEDWDYIVLNTTPIQSGNFTKFSSALNTMLSYIGQYSPNAEIGWHMNWAYQEGYAGIGTTTYETNEVSDFNDRYNGDPDTMYAAIAAAAQQVAAKVNFVIPVGTAIMNMKSSYLCDVQTDKNGIVVDGSNLSELGKLVASYTWYAQLSGKPLEDLNFTDAFLVDLSAADRQVVVEAVNNAIKTPYAVTESSYAEEPEQYEAVVNGTTTKHEPGETVTISTKAALNGGRNFLYWEATVAGEKVAEEIFDDSTARTTTFIMPEHDVEVKAVYANPEEVALEVGFGRADITPDYVNYNVPLWGYGGEATRLATSHYKNNQDDKLTITAVAISDETNTKKVITTMDLLYVPKGEAWMDAVRTKVVGEGLLANGMDLIFSATHTHSAPVVGEAVGMEGIDSDYATYYKELWVDQTMQAVRDAIADLEPVSETQISITQVPGMNFNRHFRNSLGTVSSPGRESYGTAQGMFRDNDKDMQLIRFVRDGAEDVLLVNWQGHATRNSIDAENHRNDLSADYPGALCRYVEENTEDCLVAFFQGAAGNINPHPSYLNDVGARWRVGGTTGVPASLVEDGYAQGARLGKYVIKIMENMTTVETGAVQSMDQTVKILREDLTGTSQTRSVAQEAVSIGGSIAFVTAPYEMFDRNAVGVKQASPFDMTFVLTCGPMNGYIPEWQTFFYPYLGDPKAYEASATVLKGRPGAGEDLADGLVGMLNTLYAK